MSSKPGVLEIARDAFDQIWPPVPVEVPVKTAVVDLDVSAEASRYAVISVDSEHPEGHVVFRTSLPKSLWRDLTLGEDFFLQPMVDRTLAVIEKRMDSLKAQVAALEVERDGWKAMAHDECAAFNRMVAERDVLRAQIAAFTAQNVRPLDEKPEPPPILRAIAPSRKDPRRLGLA